MNASKLRKEIEEILNNTDEIFIIPDLISLCKGYLLKGSEIKQILIYIRNGETERLKQKEWVDVAKKLLKEKPLPCGVCFGKCKGHDTMYDPNWNTGLKKLKTEFKEKFVWPKKSTKNPTGKVMAEAKHLWSWIENNLLKKEGKDG